VQVPPDALNTISLADVNIATELRQIEAGRQAEIEEANQRKIRLEAQMQWERD
jgi:hypothetical protein